MLAVYVMTKCTHVFNCRVGSVITDMHSTPESAEYQIKSYIIKDGLIDGYKISDDVFNGTEHTLVMKKWFGILKLVVEVKKTRIRKNTYEISRDL
jgi:hypothetical protein